MAWAAGAGRKQPYETAVSRSLRGAFWGAFWQFDWGVGAVMEERVRWLEVTRPLARRR